MSEPLFSKKNIKLLTDPLNNSNPDYCAGFGNLLGTGSYSAA